MAVDGVARAFCCAGCEAAARLILGQGLGRYYDFRTPAAHSQELARRDWSTYDRTEAQRRYTHLRRDGLREASLRIDGLRCTACSWLIENSLRRLAGLREAHVNPGSGRAEVVYEPAALSLGGVLRAVENLGYRPQALDFSAAQPPWLEERRAMLRRLAVAGFGMMQVMTYALSLYAGALQGIAANIEQLLRYVSLLVATPVVLYAAQPFFAAAWRGLRARTLGMDLPVALSIGAAYAFSVWTTLRGHGAVYFDSAVMFTFFLSLGRFVEMALRHRAGLQHEALSRLLPDGTLRLTAAGAERVLPEELGVGDLVRILPGERIPADGQVLAGRSSVDESAFTGEAQPRGKLPGDEVTAGTLNLAGAIEVRVRRVGQDSTLAAVSRLLERAQSDRPRIAAAADGVAAWFVGGILLLAASVGLVWAQTDADRAFATVLAVLVVTCPCALSLATPAALAPGAARLARGGLVLTRGRGREVGARVDTVVFDKTGTLTRGAPVVDAVTVLRAGWSHETCLGVAAALERHSEHPLARAFASAAPAGAALEVHNVAGDGVEATVEGCRYRIGRAEFVGAFGPPGAGAVAGPVAEGATAVLLGDARGPIALFLLSDGLRDDAAGTLHGLQHRGLKLAIASGDRAPVAAAVARRLGVADSRGDLRADDKLTWVRSLQRAGHVVAMVRDGVNDAPVLAGADVSVAVGGGTDLAKVSADLILMGQDLAPLVAGVDTARWTLRIIRQNFLWAVVYNAVAVPLAAAGWLQPWMAAIGMSGSSLLVVLNALRLLRGSAPAPSAAACAPLVRTA